MAVKNFIVTSNVGVGTSTVTTKTRLEVKDGNVKIQSDGYGLIFPDGTFQTTASTGGSAAGGTGAVQYANGTAFAGDVAKFSFNPNTSDLTVGGTINATIFNSTSDANLKKNIKPLESSIEILKRIEPVSFNWKDNDKKSYGVIAQELEKILPELVCFNQVNNHKSVSYIPLIALLINAVKELDRKIKG